MSEPKRAFRRLQIVLVIAGLGAFAAIYLFPALNIISIPIAVAAVAGVWIIGRLNDDPPDY
jgi:hypothetical protein